MPSGNGTFVSRSTSLVTSVNQCNGSDNDAAHPITCRVNITNNISADTPGARPVTAATSNQCVGSGNGGGGTVRCTLGPAVIVGHLDSMNGPSVFYRLGNLRKQDTVLVNRTDGRVAVFAVDDVRRFSKRDFPTKLVYGDTDHAALRLITCGGSIDLTTGHYRDNVVVFASLVGVRP